MPEQTSSVMCRATAAAVGALFAATASAATAATGSPTDARAADTVSTRPGTQIAKADTRRHSVVLRWRKPDAYKATPAGRLVILRTGGIFQTNVPQQLRRASRHVADARLSQTRHMLVIRLKPNVRLRHQALRNRRGVRLTFLLDPPATSPSKAAERPNRTAHRSPTAGGTGRQLAESRSSRRYRAKTLILRLPKDTAIRQAIMAFNWTRPVHVSYRTTGNDVILRFHATSETQTASIANAFRGAGFSLARKANDNRLSLRLSFSAPVKPAVTQQASRLTISLQLAGLAERRGQNPATADPSARDSAAIKPSIDLKSVAGGQEILVTTARPAPLAAFRYGQHLWVVTPRRASPDKAALEPLALGRAFAAPIRGLAMTRYPTATVLRVALAKGPYIAATRQGRTWRIRIATRRSALPGTPYKHRPIAVDSDPAAPGGALLLGLKQAGVAIPLRDPDTGAILTVFPSMASGNRLIAAQRYVRLSLLRSSQGLAILARSEGLRMVFRAGQLRISHPNGMYLSKIPPIR